MTDKEIYQQIEEHREEAQALYERIHEGVEASIVKHAQIKKRRKKLWTGILSIAAVFVITLAIVLPIVLQPQEDEEIRYSDASVLLFHELNYSLKEYYENNKLSLLYLDWYENAEILYTARYYEEGKESDTVYLYENITDGNTGKSVEISVMKRNIVVESLEERIYDPETKNIDNLQIIYTLNSTWALAKFEYQGYKYYLEFNDEITLDFLLGTIESMFKN